MPHFFRCRTPPEGLPSERNDRIANFVGELSGIEGQRFRQSDVHVGRRGENVDLRHLDVPQCAEAFLDREEGALSPLWPFGQGVGAAGGAEFLVKRGGRRGLFRLWEWDDNEGRLRDVWRPIVQGHEAARCRDGRFFRGPRRGSAEERADL